MIPIKIVYILGTLHLDGTQTQFLHLMRRLDRRRFEPRVLAFRAEGPVRDELDALGIPFTCLEFSGIRGKFRPSSYWQLFRFLRDLVRFLKHERPQIVQTFLFWTNIYGTLAAKIAGVPVIITGRRSMTDNTYMKCSYRVLQNAVNRLTTAVIANADASRQDCLREERGLSPDRVHVIYNGIDLRSFAPPRSSSKIRRESNIPTSAHIIGIIGTLSRYKAHHVFLQAAALTLACESDAIFLLIGRDEGRGQQLRQLAQNLRIEQAARFLGERKDVPALLSALDILVSSSSVEGLSNAILEGMAAGKAIVATDVGGTPEMILHEQTGLLVSPNDPKCLAEAITRLIRQPALRQQLGQAAQERARCMFGMERMVRQTEALYEKLAFQHHDHHCKM